MKKGLAGLHAAANRQPTRGAPRAHDGILRLPSNLYPSASISYDERTTIIMFMFALSSTFLNNAYVVLQVWMSVICNSGRIPPVQPVNALTRCLFAISTAPPPTMLVLSSFSRHRLLAVLPSKGTRDAIVFLFIVAYEIS